MAAKPVVYAALLCRSIQAHPITEDLDLRGVTHLVQVSEAPHLMRGWYLLVMVCGAMGRYKARLEVQPADGISPASPVGEAMVFCDDRLKILSIRAKLEDFTLAEFGQYHLRILLNEEFLVEIPLFLEKEDS